ncbi:Lantibiotic dehydratase, C terminus [Dyadobacter soli]|uniref:Lantibiotic dehydratase, C terminus n=1 Tax=Dyadobacter soli TaxID=659014 RepID=A0A1G7MIZ7_9BACT|nr:lantibiotic dehydratase family protein [Dyadobacter soli]SDF61848.1 Lantibiotic dehydratase, C terminus [Dyadobacter soli]
MTVLKSHPLALLRRPLLPESLLGSVNRALCADPASLEAQIIQVMKNLDFKEAVYLASPELYQLAKNLVETGRVPGKEKVLLALYKYLIRACTRSTPFGLFAGYTIAGLAQATNISFDGNLKKHGILSGQVLEQIGAKLAGWDAPSMQGMIGVNTSLYECGASYRYTARTAVSTQNSTGLDFRQIEGNQILRTVIEFCKPSVGLQVITDKLTSIGLSSKDSRDLIQTLVQEQILTTGPERPLSLTGYQKQLASKAATHATGEIFSAFEKMQDAPMRGADRFAGLTTALAAADIESNAPVQIDLEFGAQRCQISKNAVSGILKQLARLLSDRASPSSGLLTSFIRRFSNRYEMQLVPLPQALDPDTGIGYGHLISPSPQNEQVMNLLRQDQPASNASLFPAAWMERAYFQATATRGTVYMLTEQDLPDAVSRNIEGFSILGSIIAKSQGCLDKGEYLFELKGISGPGSAGLIARFADSNPELCQAVSQMVESEQTDYAAVVFAEIAYAANGAAGHVTRRPPLNQYQICFLTGTENEMIPLEDIMVGVRDGKAILFSKSLGKRVLPRLNSAHNFASGPPIYRFLCDLASLDAPTLFWDGALPASYPFFPRVQYGRIVVSKAQWHIGKSLLADIPESPDSHKAWWSKVRRSLGIPRMVYAGQHDRQLIIDGNCHVAIRLLIEMLQSQQVVRLTEVLRAPGPGLLTYKGKSYRNEIVIPVRSAGHIRTYQDLKRSEFAKNNVVTCHQGWLL